MSTRSADVLIVGCGPVGLTASILLADLGVSSILVERRDGSSKLPKAHYLNSRTMEIFDSFGFADEVYAAGTPADNMTQAAYYTSLGGDGPTDRKLFTTIDAFGGGALRELYERTSAYPSGNLPQKHLEPRLRRVAEERNPGAVLFNRELVAIDQDADGVTATVRGLDGELTIRTAYAIAADGGKTVGSMVGISLEGAPPFVRTTTIHFSADLSPWIQDETAMIRIITRPNADGTIGLQGFVGMGPDEWGSRSREWQVHVVAPVDSELANRTWDDAAALDYLRELFKLPELEAEIICLGGWAMESVLADRYRAGRVFVAGDAAHRHPPTSGLGLNSGAQDAHNLAWKLAAVIKGQADQVLLDSYDAERRPVAARNIEWAMLTSLNHIATQSGWGVLPGAPAEYNHMNFAATFADTPDGATRLARVRAFLATQRLEYQAREIEMGYDYYAGGAVVQDGSEAAAPDPWGTDYRQTTRPGHRMPHAWLRRADERVSTHQLLKPGAFLLLADDDGGEDWCRAARTAADRLDVEIVAVRVGAGTDLVDENGAWRVLRGHDDAGAVLVRPDGHVAYRAAGAVTDHEDAIAGALATALGRSGDRVGDLA